MGLAFMCLLRCCTESVLLDSVLTSVMVVSSAYVVEKKVPPCNIIMLRELLSLYQVKVLYT